MKRLLPAFFSLLLVGAQGLAASPQYQLPQRSVSATKQFVIYCDDLQMRMAVSGFSEETKAGILEYLGQPPDQWKIPIVINLLKRDASDSRESLSEVRLVDVEGDARKIEVNLLLVGDLTRLRFQQQLVRAILLELEYRGRPWDESKAPIEPPMWLVEGMATYLRTRNTELDVDVFKTFIEKNSLPSIENFLAQNPTGLNEASLKLYQACSMSLLQLLASLPNGRDCLLAYIRDLPVGKDGPSTDLMKHFPSLAGSTASLEKWWTLSMARLASSERYKGLSLEESEQHLAELLKIQIPGKKKGEEKVYAIEQYKEFYKLPQARPVMAELEINLKSLMSEGSPLFRPIIGEYMVAVQDLQKGKVRRMDERLKSTEKYREMLLTRMDQIADYLNWFEATQIVNRSNSFDDYMRAAQELSSDNRQRGDSISRYLDSVEVQMQ